MLASVQHGEAVRLGVVEQRHRSGGPPSPETAAFKGAMPGGYLQDWHHLDQQRGGTAAHWFGHLP